MAKASGSTRTTGAGGASATRTTAQASARSYTELMNDLSLNYQQKNALISPYRNEAEKIIGDVEFDDYYPQGNFDRVYKNSPKLVKDTIMDAYNKSLKEFNKAVPFFEKAYKKAEDNVLNAKTPAQKMHAESVRDAVIHRAAMDLGHLKEVVNSNASDAKKYLKENLKRVKSDFVIQQEGNGVRYLYKGKKK